MERTGGRYHFHFFVFQNIFLLMMEYTDDNVSMDFDWKL